MRKEIQSSLEFDKCLFPSLNSMFSWSTPVIAWALLLSSQMISFGLIGETPDQCAVRYGVPTRHDENSTEYRLKNRVLVVTFVEGRASSITCSDAPSERGGGQPCIFRKSQNFKNLKQLACSPRALERDHWVLIISQIFHWIC